MSAPTRTVHNPGGTPVHVTGFGDVVPGAEEAVTVPASESVDWLLEHGALVEGDVQTISDPEPDGAGEQTTSDAAEVAPAKTSRRRSTGGTRASETTTPAAETPDSEEAP